MSRIKYLLILLFILITFFSGCSTTSSEQPTYYGYFANAQRTKCWNVQGIRELPKKMWSYEDRTVSPGGAADFFGGNAPTVVDNIAYIGGNGVTALDIKTGKLIWYSVPQECPGIESSPVYFDGMLFAVGGYVAEDGNLVQKLLAIDAKDGKLLWKSSAIGLSGTSYSDENPIIVKGKVYLGVLDLPRTPNKNIERHIRVWDAKTGKVVNEIVLDPKMDVFFDTLATDGTYLYGSLMTGYFSYSIFCYNVEKNKVEWTFPIADNNRRNYRWSRLAISNNTIIVGYLCIPKDLNTPNELTVIKAYDIKTHKLLWRKETCCISPTDGEGFHMKDNPKIRFQYFQSPHFAVKSDRLYLTLGDGRMVCADVRTGKEIYVRRYDEFQKVSEGYFFDKEHTIRDYPEIDFYATNNVLYVTSETHLHHQKEGSGCIIALDSETGKTLWEKSTNVQGGMIVAVIPTKFGIVVTWTTNEWAPVSKPVTTELWSQ